MLLILSILPILSISPIRLYSYIDIPSLSVPLDCFVPILSLPFYISLRTIRSIWYANTLTNRIAGTTGNFSKLIDEEKIENFIQWWISDFGFRMVPIFRADILNTEKDRFTMSPLKCYVKNPDSYTILTPCDWPTIIYKNPPDIEFFLPSTEQICWEKQNTQKENQRKKYKKNQK